MQSARGLAALRYPAFRWYQAARLSAIVGALVQGVAVGWQVYTLTGAPLSLGFVGLAQFLPALLLSLPAGVVADRYDRRYILATCYVGQALLSAALFALSVSHEPPVEAIYAVLVGVGTARAFAGPAGQSLLPNLVAAEHFPNAVAWSSSVWHVGVVAGPALGGVLYAAAGRAAEVYTLACGLEIVAIGCLLFVRPRPSAEHRQRPTWRGAIAGARYVWRRPVILGALALDMFAVLFGGAVALIPVFARDILDTGPTGLGVLRSAPAMGATLMALLLAWRPLERRAGATLLGAVALFGAATVGFGLSRTFALSVALLVVAGAADMISVYVRQAIVQLATPDEMRGRVSAVNLIFIGASNELGEFESGVTAQWLGTVPAVVVGGVATCAVVAAWAWCFPALRRVDTLSAGALQE